MPAKRRGNKRCAGQVDCRRVSLIALVLMLGSCGPSPKTSVRELPQKPDGTMLNLAAFAATLQHVVGANGSIDYRVLASDTNLTQFLRSAANLRTNTLLSRQAELAFWINVYNAHVLDMLRLNGLPTSPDKIAGFYTSQTAAASGQYYSLDDIAHNIIGKQFREPRGFFALFPATQSGPSLFPEPFDEQHLSGQLDKQIRRYLADTTKNFVDPESRSIHLTGYFREFEDEIEQSVGSMLRFVRAYASSAIGQYIDQHPLVEIRYDPINDKLYQK